MNNLLQVVLRLDVFHLVQMEHIDDYYVFLRAKDSILFNLIFTAVDFFILNFLLDFGITVLQHDQTFMKSVLFFAGFFCIYPVLEFTYLRESISRMRFGNITFYFDGNIDEFVQLYLKNLFYAFLSCGLWFLCGNWKIAKNKWVDRNTYIANEEMYADHDLPVVLHSIRIPWWIILRDYIYILITCGFYYPVYVMRTYDIIISQMVIGEQKFILEFEWSFKLYLSILFFGFLDMITFGISHFYTAKKMAKFIDEHISEVNVCYSEIEVSNV